MKEDQASFVGRQYSHFLPDHKTVCRSVCRSSGRYISFVLLISTHVSVAAAVMMRKKRVFFARTVREELATSAHTH